MDYLNISSGYIYSTVNESSSGKILAIAYTTNSGITYSISNMNFNITKLASGTSYYAMIFYSTYGSTL